MNTATQPDNASELLPCPFCGGEVQRNSDKWGHYFMCNCGVRGPYSEGPAEAAARWNTRTPSPAGAREALADELEKSVRVGGGGKDDRYVMSFTDAEKAMIVAALRAPHQSSGVAVAWTIPGGDTADANGFIPAKAYQDGEFSRPLYAEPPAQCGVQNDGDPVYQCPDCGKDIADTTEPHAIDCERAALAALDEGIEILTNFMESVGKHGNFSDESTVTFIDQAAQCFRKVRPSLSSAKREGPCPYAEDGMECLLETHSFGPCLCALSSTHRGSGE